ncbi:MAG: UvrD-helicase domain-containing protein [Tissierellia bacterium]|nr:UvrD-helicase domain-containing protein [Tissierellia bacterium]
MEDNKRYFIKENGGIHNLMVEAGAGAGKTQIMVDTIVNMIKRGVKIENIVLITFTNKATNEMKERLQFELVKEAERGCEKCKEALANIQLSNVSTIHSFAKRLIDERPFETLGLDFNIIEDLDFQKRLLNIERLFIKESREKSWKEAMLEELSIYPNLRAPFDAYLLNKDMDYMVRDIERVFLDKEALTQEALELSSDFERLVTEAGEEKIKKEAYKKLTKALRSREEIENTPYLRIYMSAMADLLKDGLKLYNKDEEDIFILDKRKGKAYFDLELAATRRALPIFSKLKSQEYDISLAALVKFVDYYMEKNASSSPLLSNSELLVYTLRTVEKEEARIHFQRRYSHFFIDEFQDTDPVQAKLLFALGSANKGDLRDVKISDMDLIPGRLFVVGDPKQSIYRFRGADLNIYNSAKDKISEQGKFSVLNRTYRFHKGLADDIYKTFNSDGAYGFSKVSKAKIEISPMETVDREGETESLRNIKLVHIEGDLELLIRDYLSGVEEEIGDPDFVLKLEDEIRNYLKGALTKEEQENGLTITKHSALESRETMVKNFLKAEGSLLDYYRDYDPKRKRTYILDELSMVADTVSLTVKNLLGGNYGLTYKDILIISREKEVLKNISTALKENNIPINSSEEKTFKDYVATEAMIAFYQYLDTGNESHLKMFLSLGKDYSIEEIEGLFEEDDPIISRFRSYYDDQQKSNNPLLSAYRLLYEKEFLYGDNEREELEVTSIQVERVASESPSSLKDALTKMAKLREEVIIPVIEDENRVRVMNLHKAKGLQGKIVILVGEVKRTPKAGNYFDRVNNEAYLEFPELLWGVGKISYMDSLLPEEKISRSIENSLAESAEEALRLDYVAATRARDAIILIDPAAVYKELYLKSENTGLFPLEEISLKKKEAVLYKKEVPSLKLKKGGYLVKFPSNLDYMEEFIQLEEGLSGKSFGTLFHMIMELVVEDYKTTGRLNIRPAFTRAVRDFARSKPISELLGYKEINQDLETPSLREKLALIEREHYEFISSSIERIFSDHLKTELKGADYISTEVPFTMQLEDNQIEKIIYSGVIDLLVRKGDRLKIFDYKTDKRPLGYSDKDFSDYLDKKYERQLKLYQKASSKLFKLDESNIQSKILFIR